MQLHCVSCCRANEDCWTVMFCTVLVAVALSFVYVWVVVSLKAGHCAAKAST